MDIFITRKERNMDNLVAFLIANNQPIKIVLQPEENLKEFIACLKRKFINIVFTETNGDTEIGISILNSSVKTENIDEDIDFISLEGECGLNFEKIKVEAKVSLNDFFGYAKVTVLDKE